MSYSAGVFESYNRFCLIYFFFSLIKFSEFRNLEFRIWYYMCVCCRNIGMLLGFSSGSLDCIVCGICRKVTSLSACHHLAEFLEVDFSVVVLVDMSVDGFDVLIGE